MAGLSGQRLGDLAGSGIRRARAPLAVCVLMLRERLGHAIGTRTRRTVGLGFFCVFILSGLAFLAFDAKTYHHYVGAERVPARVVAVTYWDTARTKAGPITVAPLSGGSPGRVTIDDSASPAPGGLVVGEQVTVLINQNTPGQALFPSQHTWATLLIPGLPMLLLGTVGTAGMIVINVRLRPVPA